jgi:hypothetical protein
MLGGLAGLTKTVALEHPTAFVRHIDLAVGSVEIQAGWIAQELLQTGPVEVGVSARGRVTPGSWQRRPHRRLLCHLAPRMLWWSQAAPVG